MCQASKHIPSTTKRQEMERGESKTETMYLCTVYACVLYLLVGERDGVGQSGKFVQCIWQLSAIVASCCSPVSVTLYAPDNVSAIVNSSIKSFPPPSLSSITIVSFEKVKRIIISVLELKECMRARVAVTHGAQTDFSGIKMLAECFWHITNNQKLKNCSCMFASRVFMNFTVFLAHMQHTVLPIFFFWGRHSGSQSFK